MLSVPSLEVNEGGQATYTVSLETQPSGNVSVAIAEADLSPGTERNATDSNITVTHTAAGADYDGVSANRRDSGGRANRKRPLRQDERFRRWTCRGNADTDRTPKRQVMRSIGSFRRLVFHELATTNTTEIGTAMLPLRRVTLPALTDASPSATPARLAHLSRNEPPPAPPPNPRTPESSPPSPGGSSSASNRRASRLLAGTALSRAGSAACYVAGAFLAALAVLLTLPLEAQAQTATMVLSPTSLDVPEAGSASYSVKLGTLPTAEVTVSIGGTSGTDLSLNMASLTFTTSNWDTAQMVTVSAAGDSDATHDMATLTHTASGGGYGSVSADLQVTVTDITRMRLVAVIETVTEGESKPIRARIPMPLDVDVSITVTVAPNGGRAGGRADEYELSANTTLTIAAGTMESTGTVEFTSLDDFTYTGTRYFNATLTPDHPRVDAGTERLTVVDDDNTISLLQVAPSRIFESGGTAMLLGAKVSLHEGVVKMEVSLEPSGRATLSGNTLTFPPGALYATETLTITAVDNTSDETDQVITISATVTEGRGIRTPAPVQLTIVDDEGMSPEVALVLRPPRVREGLPSTVTALASAPLDNEATITVSASPGHADTRTDDYALSADPVLTIPAGGTRSTGTVTIATVDDQFHVGSRRRVVTVSGTVTGGGGVSNPADQTLTVLEDDQQVPVAVIATPATIAEGEVSTITLRSLGGALPADVNVTIRESSDEVELSADPVLMIAEGETESTGTVTLTAVQDTDMRNGVVTVFGDPDNAFVRVAPASVFTVDDDATEATLTVSPVPARFYEGETSTIIAALSRTLSDDVTVTIGVDEADVNHTATADDYTLSGDLTFTIPAGDMRGTGPTLTASNDEYFGPLAQRQVVLDIASVTGTGIDRVVKHSDWYIFEDEEQPRVTLAVTPASIAENNGQSTVTASLNTIVESDVEVTVTTEPAVAAQSDDFTQTGTLLTISAGQKTGTGTVTISAVDDDVDGPDKNLVVRGAVEVVGMEQSGLVWFPYDESLTIQDDDEPGLVLSKSSLGPAEGGSESYTVRLATQPTGQVTVTITGHSGTDLTLGETSLTFTTTNWSTAQTVTVTAGQDDDTADDEETLTHTASGGGYGSVAEDLPVTVDDDDEPVPGLVLSKSSLGPAEGASESYTVALATQPTGQVTVTITGHSGTDLTLGETSLTFTTTNWSTAQTVTVTAGQDDDTADDEETLTHTASGGGYGSVAEDLPVTVDDDDEPVPGLVLSKSSLGPAEGASESYTVALATQPTGQVTVTITGHSGTDLTLGETSLTFTTTNWSTAQTVTVTAGQDDDTADDEETLTHTASGGGYGSVAEDLPVTVDDDDEPVPGLVLSKSSLGPAEGASESYTVALATQPTGQVTVTITGHSGTDLTLGETSLTFTTTNWSTAQTVTVTAGQDDDTADDEETLTHTASGGGYGSVAEDLPVTVDDDDEPVPGLVLSKSSLGPAEGASESYTVALATQPTGQVTVTITGHSGTDLTLDETSLTFTTTNWSTAQTVTVTAGQDDDTADDEETLTHTASGGGYGSVAEDLPVTVDDDDEPVPGLVLSKSSLGPAESSLGPAGASESYTVALATQPTGQVTVTITGHSGTDLTLDETSLTFTTTNWSTAQTVTVTAGQDDDTADDEETLTHTASGGGYGSVAEDLPVTVDDDDEPVPGLVLSKSSLGPAEGASESYTVALATQPTGQVTVTITGHSGTDLTLGETSLTFTTTNWSTAQTVTVTAGQDDDTADDEETLTHTASGGGYGSVAEDLPVTVDDDDTDTEPLVLTVEAVKDVVTEGEPVRYRILMSRPTSGAVVQSVYSYTGDFVHRRHRLSRVVTGVSSHGSRLYWERELETLDDAIDEEDGSFTVRIQKPDADLYDQGEEYTVGTPSSATVTILDNDPEDTPTVPLVSVFDASVDEGPDAVLAFPVRLNVAVVETATIEWETRDLSAKAGQDYKGASGTLVFSPGETVKTVRVEVIDDAQVEGTEVMLLLLTDVEGAVIDGELAVGTIKDNDAASDTAEDALALVDDLTPGVAAAVLLGEQTLGEAELAALDRLGNGNGRYDLGDLLSWIDRCRRGEAHCGRTSTDSGPAAAALLGGAAAGGRSTPRRPGRRDSGRRGRSSTGGIRHRARVAGYALAILLAATMTWSCTEGSVAPVAPRPDPGFLTVEWSGPATHRDVGVLLELEGPTIDAVRAPGLELYESSAPGPHQIVVAGVLRPGPLVQFRVPDRNQFALYRVRVLQVTGEDYGLRDVGEYQAVITVHR